MSRFVAIIHALLAGVFGGLVNSLAVWGFGALGITPLLGADIAPPLTTAWLLPRLFFGGLWGLLFLSSWPRGREWARGALFSIAPTLYMLFKVFPQLGKGVMGLALGPATPLWVVFFNLVWGVSGILAYDLLRRSPRAAA
ncbi:hypothetical protein dsx2_2913 [Desulfovibrio sp. X2]|uniref:hypothetical protein n=1 Tax=Desulfovibrio sp. X2 TaxID=941449 RepID=UPI000358E09B|nr:hypothetical protein [Desulfovibrio sp. X2]EPR42126.1 hypothetical protein dsx2_2913 [Desulfovibrio sp. X2]